MSKPVVVIFMAILFSNSASAGGAPHYEGRWHVASSEPIVTSQKKGNVTRTTTTRLSSDLKIKICPNSKKTGWNLALLLPIGLAVGSTPIIVNKDGSITAVQKDGSKRLHYHLLRNQNHLSGTIRFNPNESNPNPVVTPVSFVRTGGC